MMLAMTAWALTIPPLVFMAAVGACMGSFLNVVAYRMPRAEGLFRPGSRCPHCGTPLTWRENVPVLGWLWLRGRCRFCRSPISPEYPLVELACALLFAGVWGAWYSHSATGWSAPSAAAPEWARAGLGATWPMFMLILTLLGSLVGMTLIDAKTFTIPPALPWLVTGLALITHPLHAAVVTKTLGALTPFSAAGAIWTIPTPQGPVWLGATLLAGVGVLVSIGLMRVGVIPRSFDDFAEWEANEAARASEGSPAAASDPMRGPSLRVVLTRALAFTGPAIAGMALGMALGMRWGKPMLGMGAGAAAGLIVGTMLRAFVREERNKAPEVQTEAAPMMPPEALTGQPKGGVKWASCLLFGLGGGALGAMLHPGIGAAGAGLGILVGVVAEITPGMGLGPSAIPAAGAPGAPQSGAATPHWLEYPHSRREMWKEVCFLLPIVALGLLGGWLGSGGSEACRAALATPPLWLGALGGSLLGLLVAGGLVWGVRILATLAVGKEAMGMGDVHLLAAVGAVLGWIDPTLAFFIAPAFGLGYAAWSSIRRGRSSVALPYGPHLALATVGVILWKPWVEAGLTFLLSRPIDLP